MPEQLPDDVEALRVRAAAFVDDVLRPADAQIAEGDGDAASRVREASKEAGFFYMTQPEEFGGRPGTSLELTVLRVPGSCAGLFWVAGNLCGEFAVLRGGNSIEVCSHDDLP